MQAGNSSQTPPFTTLFQMNDPSLSSENALQSVNNDDLLPRPTSSKDVSSPQEDIDIMSRLAFQYKEMAERFYADLCEVILENANLRKEIAFQKEINENLSHRITLLLSLHSAKSNDSFSPPGFSDASAAIQSMALLNDFRQLSVEDESPVGGILTSLTDSSPTSVLTFERSPSVINAGGGTAANTSAGTSLSQRTTLPKSISIRSTGFLKMNQGGGTVRNTLRPSRDRVAGPIPSTRLRVSRGGEEDQEPVEVEAFKQGMFKTELCNKWQQTGACPYGDHCQFAHGIEELRPVIRHPRYKTELCRMVVTGGSCPYGHRCHFRHALTQEEKGLFTSG